VRVAEWSDAYAAAVEGWSYDPPYDFYDSYERLGFHEVGRETRSFPDHGENEFLRMERPA
jgi:hypothetical protein